MSYFLPHSWGEVKVNKEIILTPTQAKMSPFSSGRITKQKQVFSVAYQVNLQGSITCPHNITSVFQHSQVVGGGGAKLRAEEEILTSSTTFYLRLDKQT